MSSALSSALGTRSIALIGWLLGGALAVAVMIADDQAFGRAAGVGGNAGAHRPLTSVADAQKVTKAWRCKKRGPVVVCHTYRAGIKAFGEAVRQLRPPLAIEPWSRVWCGQATPCAPLVTDL